MHPPGFLVEASPSCKHLKLGCIFICCHAHHLIRACSWVHAILSQSGSPKVLLIPASSSARVENVEEWDRITLVSLLAQTCTIPPCMKERAYRIFILSSVNVLSCIMTA